MEIELDEMNSTAYTPLLGDEDNNENRSTKHIQDGGSPSDSDDLEYHGELVEYNSGELTRSATSESRMFTEHSTTNMQTFMHLMKGNIGCGLLGLAYAVKHAGILLGPLALLAMSLICVHCMKILVDCSHELCKKTGHISLDYGGVAEEAFQRGSIGFCRQRGHVGRRIVNGFLILTQLGFCCVYFVFMADNLMQVYQHFYGARTPDIQVFLAILLLPVLLYCYIRNLDDLAIFSTLANLILVVGIIIVYQYLIQGIIESTYVIPDSLPLVAKITDLPIFFGSAIYAFEGIGVVLPLENKMKFPGDFKTVLYIGMGLVTMLYLTMGILGYMCFGDKLQETITLDLPGDGLYLAVKILFSGAIFVSYGLQFYVPVSIVWPTFRDKLPERFQTFGEYVFRTILVIITLALAAGIPMLGLFISLVGSVASSALALIFPPILEELTFYNGYQHFQAKMRLTKNILIVTFGLIGFIFGTFVSVVDIVEAFLPTVAPTTINPTSFIGNVTFTTTTPLPFT